jgi:hypothetical protein
LVVSLTLAKGSLESPRLLVKGNIIICAIEHVVTIVVVIDVFDEGFDAYKELVVL